MDEIDEMDEEVYTSALSQPQSKFGIPATTGKLSTNHRINGIMDLAIKKAEEQSIPIYKWCIWDGIESCVDYSCSTCKLSSLCPGEQMKGATGYYKIEDCIQKLHNVSMATFSLEWLCEKTGRSDLIYGSQYNEKIHSSESAPDFNPGKKTILSLDWGGTLPFTAGAWQKFPIGWVRVDEVVVENTTNKRFIEACSKKPWWRTVREAVADPARADLISEWKELRIPGHGPIWVYQADNSVLPGIEAVRDCLAPVFGLPKFYVNKKCKYWIMEAGNYAEKNGKPVKAFDHTMDDTRYFVTRYIKPLKRMRIRGLS